MNWIDLKLPTIQNSWNTAESSCWLNTVGCITVDVLNKVGIGSCRKRVETRRHFHTHHFYNQTKWYVDGYTCPADNLLHRSTEHMEWRKFFHRSTPTCGVYRPMYTEATRTRRQVWHAGASDGVSDRRDRPALIGSPYIETDSRRRIRVPHHHPAVDRCCCCKTAAGRLMDTTSLVVNQLTSPSKGSGTSTRTSAIAISTEEGSCYLGWESRPCTWVSLLLCRVTPSLMIGVTSSRLLEFS